MQTLHQHSNQAGISLVELLVVVALMAVLAGVAVPNLSGWNCRQEIKNDFDRLNGLLYTLRTEAVNRNQSMMARVYRSNPALIRAWENRRSARKGRCGGGGWIYLGFGRGGRVVDIQDIRFDKAILASYSRDTCFHADGTASSSSYIVSGICDGTDYRYRTQVYSATGFLERSKRNPKTRVWEEI